MSQSPLARSTRRALPTFAHAPSRLSKSHSSRDLPDEAPAAPTTPQESSSFSTPKRDSAARYRSTGTTPATTPTIHYSPYATSTPPGGLSRSSSVPFDMAASAKAGRKAEEEARKRSMAPVPGSGKRPKRLVRKKPVWEKIVAFPSDMADRILMAWPTGVEDIFPPHHLANPIALGIHSIHYLLLAPLFPSHNEPDSVLLRSAPRMGPGGRWDKWEEEGKVPGRGLGGGWATLLFTLFLLAMASANSVYLFTRFRTYDLQLRSAQDPVASPHASPVPAPKVERDEDVFGGNTSEQPGNSRKEYARRVAHVLWHILKWSFRATLAVFGHSSNSKLPGTFTPSADKIQSLRVWDPPEFCLAFFCAFPPSAPLLSYLLTPLHPLITPVLHLVVSFLLSHLAASYAQLVKDRMLLSAEVMREYDRRFVYKKVFSTRVDRGVGTHEAENVW